MREPPRRLPWPRHAALTATLGLAALQGVTRLLTPAAANMNLAFAVWSGWESSFPSYAAYEMVLLGGAGAAFFCGDRLLRRWAPEREESLSLSARSTPTFADPGAPEPLC
jgi:hypothetical protein